VSAVVDGMAADVAHDKLVPMWRQRLRIFLSNKLAFASSIYLILLLLACFLVPIFHPTNQTNQALTFNAPWNQPPSWHHWLGTDSQGFDEMGRIFFGGEYSLTLGVLAGFITIVVGTIYGMVSGFFGGIADTLMMRLLDAFLSIPYLFLLITLITVFGRSTTFLIVIIGLTGWWGNARIIRSSVDSPSGLRRRFQIHGFEWLARHSPSRLSQLDLQHRHGRHVLGRRRHLVSLGTWLPRPGYPNTSN